MTFLSQVIASGGIVAASPAEPSLNAAYWSPGEAGVSVSLVSGDAILATTDFSWRGRMLTLALERVYRSGTLGYGPLGSAGWHSPLFARLRENGVTGEVQYHDGRGRVFRFLPRGGEPPPDGWEDDPNGGYCVPKGLYVRLLKLGGGQGWMLIGRHHDIARFDAEGRLTEISDRLRQVKEAHEQGSTIRFFYDAFGQLKHIEDDLGRKYHLAYFENPEPEAEGGDGPRYGLLKKVTDFAGRTIEYEFDDQRRLVKVKLPEIATTAPEYGQYAHTGGGRPTIEYRYDPQANVTPSETNRTAILHGRFAALRLEGFIDPGSTVLRARFEYDGTTGRVKTVAFPDPDDRNEPGTSVAWSISYPAEADTAAPATKAVVRAPWGQATEYTLDRGRITEVKQAGVEALAAGDPTPPLGGAVPVRTLATAYAYEDDGRLKRVTRADGSLVELAYGAGDRLARANVATATERPGAAPAGPVSYAETATAFSYSMDNLVERSTDAEGRAVSAPLAPAGGGAATSGFHAEGVLTTLTYDRFGRTTRGETAGAAPVVTTLTFGKDERGLSGAGLLESVTAGGFTETFRYDDRGEVKERATSYGTSSRFVNDEWGRVVEEIAGASAGALAPVNARSQRAFDAAGRLVRERRFQTGIGWVETRYEYNARDQVKSVTQTGLAGPTPGGALVEGTTGYGYDAFGRLATTTSPAGIVTTMTYDGLGRVASTQTGVSGSRRRAFDQLGRLVFSSDGHDGYWRGRFDGWGRLFEEQSAASALVERQHDRAGGLVRESVFADPARSQLLQQTTFTPTSFGAIARSEELVSGGGSPTTSVVTTHAFDGSGRVIATRRSAAGAAERLDQQIAYEPGTGRQLSIATPAGTTSYAYTSGTPWADSITTAESGGTGIQVTSTVAFDAFGRAIREERAGTLVERRLDEVGNTLSTSIGGSNRQDLTYDSRGLALAARKPAIGQEVSNGYDVDGRLLLASVARQEGGQEQTAYAYDASGRLISRARPSSPAETLTYNADDTVATVTTRQGLTVAYGYDAANRVTGIVPSGSPAGPSRLAPLDGGDVMTYDPLGRLTSIGIAGRPESLVTYSDLDTRGLPRLERVAGWPAGAAIEREYDAFGNTIATRLPQGLAGTVSFPGYSATYDALDRMTSTAPIDGGAPFGATLAWGGQARPLGATTGTGLVTSLTYNTAGGRLASLSVASGQTALGALHYGWDAGHDLKIGREAAAGATPSVMSNLGWAASYDAARRLSAAETGQGNVAGATTKGAALGGWTYGLGKADELLAVANRAGGRSDYASGPEGRIEARTGPDGTVPFVYDLEGRRIEDDRFTYTWDWRGRLVQTEPKAGEHAGERLVYAYDGAGRLASTTTLGRVPEGGADADRAFVAKRAHVWDGQRLASSVGLNFQDQPIWRTHYAPGHRWLDDAPQVRVERDLLGTPTTATLDLLRDEMGTVLAVAEARQGQPPRLLARFLSSPYGEQHVELGPELVRIAFDGGVTELGTHTQAPAAGESVGGALRVITTLPLDPASLAAGIVIETLVDGGGWAPANPADVAVGPDPSDPTSVLILRLPAWPKDTRCRITLTAALLDGLGRSLRLPSGEAGGVAVVLEVPGDGQTQPAYDRHFELTPDDNAAGDTLGGELPGGLGQGFQGLLADGATGLLHARHRVFDPKTTSWLSPDPIGAVDSVNLYSFVGLQPTMAMDPLGLLGANTDVNYDPSVLTILEKERAAVYAAAELRRTCEEAGYQANLAAFHEAMRLRGEQCRTYGCWASAPTFDDWMAGQQQVAAYNESIRRAELPDICLRQIPNDLTGMFAGAGARAPGHTVMARRASRSGGRLPALGRPSWRQSEADVANTLGGSGFREQVSYRGGNEVRWGTAGSVRPEQTSIRHNLAVEVKNYDLTGSSGRAALVRRVLQPLQRRSQELPAGVRQGLVLDLRGQAVPQAVVDATIAVIVAGSQGAISVENIEVLR